MARALGNLATLRWHYMYSIDFYFAHGTFVWRLAGNIEANIGLFTKIIAKFDKKIHWQMETNTFTRVICVYIHFYRHTIVFAIVICKKGFSDVITLITLQKGNGIVVQKQQ
jgi:hypothetical protein